ncbi:MAG: hypothetical protein ABIK89_20945 [Planctomycetota bacterium]
MDFLQTRLATYFVVLLSCAAMISSAAVLRAEERTAIEVREPAGIRRFQYPVAFSFTLAEPVPRETRFRLLKDDQPAPAQFRAAEAGENVSQWWLDFPVNLLPYQAERYTVEYGRDVPEGPIPKRGHKLIQTDEAYQVANEPYIAWSVPRDLKGLLSSVRSRELEYLRPESPGLLLTDREGSDHPLGGAIASVIREGPLAVGLRFEAAQTDPALEGVRSVVDLVFPVFKSWVEVDWHIDDPRGKLAGVKAKLNMNLDEPTAQAPTLIDFGATSLVYVSLRPGQETELRAVPIAADGGQKSDDASRYVWQVLRGSPDRLEPFVFGPKRSGVAADVEGWVHVMDRGRCLALAVDRFGGGSEDRLSVSAEGSVELDRRFPSDEANAQPNAKRLRFWMHFVPFPPQHTAATSPQSMQTPIEVRVFRDE